MTTGPIVGHTDKDHVRIWGRGEYKKLFLGKPRRVFGIVRHRRHDSEKYEAPIFFKLNPNFDMSGVAIISGLTPDTNYRFQMGCFNSEKEMDAVRRIRDFDWSETDSGEFRTAGTNAGKPLRFVFGSCRYMLKLFNGTWFETRGDKTFNAILNQIDAGRATDKFLMIGDQIYADDLGGVNPAETIDEYLQKYREAFSQPHIRRLMRRVSTYMILDDHEIEDNWPHKAGSKDMVVKYPAAIHAYQIYQVSHSPVLSVANGKLSGVPERFYYTFSDNCADFFVADVRTERDCEENRIMTPEQFENLLDWLGDESGNVKFVVTAVPFFPDSKKLDSDKWSGFKHERDALISFIRKRGIKKAVFLSGDIHCSVSAALDVGLPGDEPLKIHSVVSSAFFWPYPHYRRNRFRLSGHVASANDDKAYTLSDVSDFIPGDHFTRMDVDPSGFSVEVYGRKGERKMRKRFCF